MKLVLIDDTDKLRVAIGTLIPELIGKIKSNDKGDASYAASALVKLADNSE
jgi:hypothetical protein